MKKELFLILGLALASAALAEQMVTPKVPAYTVAPDLSNIVNRRQFGKFTEEQKALLARYAFFVTPSKHTQLYVIYEDNDYLQIPSFITTDCVLHLYHLFYDHSLRRLEQDKLLPLLKSLTQGLVEKSVRIHDQAADPKVKEAALKNCVYFGVAAKLLRLTEVLPPKAKALREEELKRIEQHSGREPMSLFPYEMDYTQFIPRGHYTRSEALKKYFKAMMWYGLTPFSFEKPVSDTLLLQSLLVSYSLRHAQVGGESAWEVWQHIYEPTALYVGKSNTLTPEDMDRIIAEVYPKDIKAADFSDPAKFKQVKDKIASLAEPKIRVAFIDIPGGKQFRFMGQRYLPDSEMMQRLIRWPERPFPKGLDVFAVLGSARAKDLLLNFYQEQKQWPPYPDTLEALRKQFSALPEETWHSNLYWGWMDCWQPLLQPKKEGYPSFMTNPAWADKTLFAILANWAELRHDTILYGTQVAAEKGEGELLQVRGYVEPEVEFYARLILLLEKAREGLIKHGLFQPGAEGDEYGLHPPMEKGFDRFLKEMKFLKSVSEKELQDKPLTKEEYDRIKDFGGMMDYLLQTLAGGPDVITDTDKDMAVIADVATSQNDCLEEGVGHANEIYVVVPIHGKLYLTRGATFSYYEFTHPASDRLTDESWQKMLYQGKAAGIPEWTKSFLTGPKSKLPKPKFGG